MEAASYHSACSPFHAHFRQDAFSSRPRKINGCVQVCVKTEKLSERGGKKANLGARKKERIKLPNYGDRVGENENYHISKFFSHPSGIESILNTSALQSYQFLDSNLYRCVLPQIKFLSFRVSPVLDLQVIPTNEDCVVEMLSCKFEGSKFMERQNEKFSAFMRNHIKWESVGAEQYLDVDVKLNLILEIYTRPFTLMPISAVEGPGNKMMQTLVDQLVPLLIKQLLQDYEEWIHQQCKCL
ncbi:Protein of unknown function (DUF1997 [Striga hermonthica]|uniref:DUF1997 family protein n=1 Tax=Striga hermonthica TaxID=68872 RepID=A0A9N7R6R2_STRHE|nr:Protein of unknown function (DUF1997 [Striga hermonthica]